MKLTPGLIMDVVDQLYVLVTNNPKGGPAHALLSLGSGIEIEIIVRRPDDLSESTSYPALTDVDVLL